MSFRSWLRATFPLLALALAPTAAQALEPRDVVVIANRNVPESRAVAEHYLKQRGVPAENLVALDLPAGDEISRGDYDRLLAGPLRAALKERRDHVKVLLTVYGVPLRVADAPGQPESAAAVDSELMLLWAENYPLARWLWNPLHWQYPAGRRAQAPPVVMACRLDGPTPEIAKGLVDQALAAERQGGLRGRVYIDARGLKFDAVADKGLGLAGYDESLRDLARLLQSAKLPVTLDDRAELFGPGACLDCALYCGWYSLSNYVDSFRFVPGAVAWHIASYELGTLRGPAGQGQWCRNLLKKGAAVTMGPVTEPYVVGFPKPAEFFGFLATGEYTLVECYARTTYMVSWRLALIGDPLYNPFGKSKPLRVDQVKPSPAGGIQPFDVKP